MAHAEMFADRWGAIRALEARFLAYAKEKCPGEAPRRAHINPVGDAIIYLAQGYLLISRSEIDPLP